ncbi:MAG: amino-acid N-acetyltransferase [Spirochaetales bacterium]|nr:amino-acid N-acetyltransferase [Spirochaetales bacterium]
MDMLSFTDQVDTIRTAFSYINRFKGHTFVIKIVSSLFSHPLFPLLIKDIVLLHKMGIRIVLIPGARERINEILKTYNIKCRTVDNIRITPAEAMPFIKMAGFDVSNKLMTFLAENNTSAIIGNWVKARSIGVVKGIDFQSSGTVEKLKVEIVEKMLDEGLIPIFPNIGWSTTGKPYNISSNELAFTVSRDLHASKLFFITNFDGVTARDLKIPEGVYINNDNHITQLTAPQARNLLDLNKKKEKSKEYELINVAFNACINGVDRVHIINGSIEGMLIKEIFSNRGLGTMIYNDPHENIRSASFADISDIIRIMRPAIADGILVPRTSEDVAEKIDDYVIYEVDGTPHACGALHIYNDEQAEIAGIAVDNTYSSLGIGKKIINFLLDKAIKHKLKQIFVLTTQTSDWFVGLGFKRDEVSVLPQEKQKQYNKDRNSLIFTYTIDSVRKKRHYSVE